MARAIYFVTITLLIRRVKQDGVKQIWFADVATSGGKLDRLFAWWNSLSQYGPMYWYFMNCDKTWLVVKEKHYGKAKKILENTGVNITTEVGGTLMRLLDALRLSKVTSQHKAMNGLKKSFVCQTSPPPSLIVLMQVFATAW